MKRGSALNRLIKKVMLSINDPEKLQALSVMHPKNYDVAYSKASKRISRKMQTAA